ncbi:D-lactaldehyde dehydrogenase [Coniophora puteana RWD-64-598 SS2]|uniref:D-lactaldehyde dehydrogenase n=1 Tax=Coniophora puteana (strain RWD-64-598) TaxID=741705 RepID=A0A5M3N0V7_CONPW|nr:D-lactaldehyde dehydrogenase [Coniophora puteana RWD-64-598 SS2]EIW84521.1 D-lactaldehyde dehydrogenase [Coniophora puteana RWD-64-598 SS2]
MPAIHPTDAAAILVTGSNGFIGTHIISILLSRGFSVHAAVRSEAKGQHLLDTFHSYGDRLRLVIVDNLTQERAFDSAVKDIQGVIHSTLPVTDILTGDPNELIAPAVQSVKVMLESVLKQGTSVERVVFTSSCATIRASSIIPVDVSESDWNDAAVDDCEAHGAQADALNKCSASKVLAEKAVWDFYAAHKHEVAWDVCVLNPPWVFGVPMHPISSPESLNASCAYMYNALIEGNFQGANPHLSPGHGWVNIRDVAEAHVRALERPVASGEKIILSAGSPWFWADLVNTAAILSPASSTFTKAKAAVALANASKDGVGHVSFKSTKASEILGLEFTTMEKLVGDVVSDYRKRGWIA